MIPFASGDLTWSVEEISEANPPRAEIAAFLRSCDLSLDPHVTELVTVRSDGRLVACAGTHDDVVKCVAVAPALRGGNITATLMTQVSNLAADRGVFHLFLYTKPGNRELFESCGFYTIVEVPGAIVLMENTPVGISRYCESLAAQRRPGKRIGCIVMNANPFTFGHLYLVQKAAEGCDWLHVFVVGENASLIAYEDRLMLVREGLRDVSRTTVHPGSRYMISKVTFPSYFLKSHGMVDQCYTALDLLVFREHIAPALGITHRYVGTEPFCPVSAKYNADMKHWLTFAVCRSAPVTVVEIERLAVAGRAISASEVRQLLRHDNFDAMSALAPAAIVALLRTKYGHPATESMP